MKTIYRASIEEPAIKIYNRFAYELKAALMGDTVSSIGRILTKVRAKKEQSGLAALLNGPLALIINTLPFSRNLNSGLGNSLKQTSFSSQSTSDDSPQRILLEFSDQAIPSFIAERQFVSGELAEALDSVAANKATQFERLISDEGQFIGPLQTETLNLLDSFKTGDLSKTALFRELNPDVIFHRDLPNGYAFSTSFIANSSTNFAEAANTTTPIYAFRESTLETTFKTEPRQICETTELSPIYA